MRTLHVGLRVEDLERSLAFYTSVGYELVGTVPETEFGSLTMLALPGDEFVALELVHDPTYGRVEPGGLSHFVTIRYAAANSRRASHPCNGDVLPTVGPASDGFGGRPVSCVDILDIELDRVAVPDPEAGDRLVSQAGPMTEVPDDVILLLGRALHEFHTATTMDAHEVADELARQTATRVAGFGRLGYLHQTVAAPLPQ